MRLSLPKRYLPISHIKLFRPLGFSYRADVPISELQLGLGLWLRFWCRPVLGSFFSLGIELPRYIFNEFPFLVEVGPGGVNLGNRTRFGLIFWFLFGVGGRSFKEDWRGSEQSALVIVDRSLFMTRFDYFLVLGLLKFYWLGVAIAITLVVIGVLIFPGFLFGCDFGLGRRCILSFLTLAAGLKIFCLGLILQAFWFLID